MGKKLVDVIFVLGSSGADAEIDFENQKKAVENFINTQKIVNAIYGIVYYGKVPKAVIPLLAKFRETELKNALEYLMWREEGRSLPAALKEAERMFKEESRPGSRKVLVFFTNETPKGSLKNTSELLEEMDVKLIPVAVGDQIDEDSLRKTNSKDIVIVLMRDGKPAKGNPTIEEETLNGKCRNLDRYINRE